MEVTGPFVQLRRAPLRAVATNHSAAPSLLLVPRGGGTMRAVRLPDPAWVVHFGGAFERDGDVVVDACVFDHLEFGEEFGYAGPRLPFDPARPEARGPQRLYRITVPAHAREARWERLSPHGVDFPRIHPAHEGRETPALFGATRRDTRFSDPFDTILRVDLRDPARPAALWSVPDNTFVGEPVLDAADRQGLALPYSCRNGGCTICAGKLLSGEAEMGDQYVLEPEQIAAGFRLLCCAWVTSDATIITHQNDAVS